MKRFIYICFLVLTLPLHSMASTCTVSSGVTTVDNNSCGSQPDSYGIRMYKMYLCTSAPTEPTTTTAANLSTGGCVLVLNGGTDGVRVDVTGSTKVNFTGATFTKPPAAVYTHGYMHIDNIFFIKQQRIFNEAKEGRIDGNDSGIHCSTVSGSGNETDGKSSTCGSSAIAAGTWGSILLDLDGGEAGLQATAEAENLNNTGSDIKGILIDTNGHVATTTGEVDSLEGFQTFGTPVVVGVNLKSFDIAFGITEGSTIFEDNNSPPVVGFGSGPFQAVITPINHQ
tara:strand:+ start:4397 stop:5245 length:849 start_codon:yes stop_codon:yes gene_type:complete